MVKLVIEMSIFSYKKIYQAYLECRQGKRKTLSALDFEIDLEENLLLLLDELRSGEYSPGRSICFAVKEPKPREIFAAGFRDRVVHHLLVKEIIEASERSFFCCSFACRKGKGTHKAVSKLKKNIRQVTENNKQDGWYLQMDISNFFSSIDHNILYEIFSNFILKQTREENWKQEMLWLGRKIIFHRPQDDTFIKGDVSLWRYIPKEKSLFYARYGAGLPIGNYSSQFFANLYLNELDYFVKQVLRQRHYIRYVDDLIILGKDFKELSSLEERIDSFLKEHLSIRLNPNKTKLKLLERGVDFLGYLMKPEYTLSRQRVVNVCKNKARCGFMINNEVIRKKQKNSLKKKVAQINSYMGHFRHADSFRLRKNMMDKHLYPILSFVSHDEKYRSLKIIQ